MSRICAAPWTVIARKMTEKNANGNKALRPDRADAATEKQTNGVKMPQYYVGRRSRTVHYSEQNVAGRKERTRFPSLSGIMAHLPH